MYIEIGNILGYIISFIWIFIFFKIEYRRLLYGWNVTFITQRYSEDKLYIGYVDKKDGDETFMGFFLNPLEEGIDNYLQVFRIIFGFLLHVVYGIFIFFLVTISYPLLIISIILYFVFKKKDKKEKIEEEIKTKKESVIYIEKQIKKLNLKLKKK